MAGYHALGVGDSVSGRAPWVEVVAVRSRTSHTESMAQVDSDDDEIERFVVRRYVYDAPRRQRRHVVVVAFDNRDEFEAAVATLTEELQRRRGSGAVIDPQEHITGIVLGPGHRRQQRNGRVLLRAIQHGATLNEDAWDRLTCDLPRNVGVSRSASNPQA